MEINTNNLIPGQVYDTYTALCAALNKEPARGNSKIKQLRDFDRYFKYEQDGRKYIIKEVYKEPLPEEYRIAANAKYVTYVENLLLSYLSQQKEEKIYITPQRLWLILGMVNNKYISMRPVHRRQELLSLSEDMNMFDINNFFFRSNMKIRDILKNSLTSLKRRKLLISEEVYMIGFTISDYNTFQTGLTYREATDPEKKYILKTERKILRKLGFETDFQMLASEQRSAYYDELGDILRKEKGWENVYHCYKFIYDKVNMLEAINENEEAKSLNQLMIDALNEQAKNNYDKKGITAANANERAILEDSPFFYYHGYPERQQLLADELIRIPVNT